MFYCIDKAAGPTTREAVKSLLQVKGRGFGVEGILDPFASGLLIAATGLSTRFLSYFLPFSKTYRAQITLGAETDTLDSTGDITQQSDVPPFDESRLAALAAQFTGEISQIPPLYSNLRVDGLRGHEIARQGKTAELKPRIVRVHELALKKVDGNLLSMRCTVSSGTYIRSLARDIAAALGTLGYLSELRRIRIGELSVADEPSAAHAVGFIAQELSDANALSFFEALEVDATGADKFYHGEQMRLKLPETQPGTKRIFTAGKFIGLGRWDGQQLHIEKNYPTEGL